VPRIPPPTIVTSQGSMCDFEEPSGVYYLCALAEEMASRLPSDLDSHRSDGPVERDRGIRDTPLQLRVWPKAQADIIFHDAVVQHARFCRRVQPDCDVTDSCPLRLRLPQHSMQELFVLGSCRFDDP